MKKELILICMLIFQSGILYSQGFNLPDSTIVEDDTAVIREMDDWGPVNSFRFPADTNFNPSPYEFVSLNEEPKPLNLEEIRRSIVYPDSARVHKIQGVVVVRVLIDTEGKYVRHILMKDPNPQLTSVVESKIAGILCIPGVMAGMRVKSWVTLPFDFKLN